MAAALSCLEQLPPGTEEQAAEKLAQAQGLDRNNAPVGPIQLRDSHRLGHATLKVGHFFHHIRAVPAKHNVQVVKV